jgi:5-methylcytosine-specific restriction endonuclease McrA
VSPIRPENRERYPADWREIRGRILKRATCWIPGSMDFIPRCECRGECGRGTHEGRCPNFNGGLAYGSGSTVVLTIAHLDHTPENNEPENLRAMCQGCHLHYDREHHAETRARTRREAREASGQIPLRL